MAVERRRGAGGSDRRSGRRYERGPHGFDPYGDARFDSDPYGSDPYGGSVPRDSARATAPYSRSHAAGRYARKASGRSHRKRSVRIAVAAAVGVVVIALVAAAVWAATFYGSLGSRMNGSVSDETRAVLASQRRQARDAGSALTDTDPFYMLLLGTDSSENRRTGTEAGLYGDDDAAYRTDTIILARIDPGDKKVTLVSIHRDTYYPIDGEYRKINAAYALGGVAETIEVVSEYAGVPITHYASIDMSGLSALVDALGGVEVDVPYEIDDEEHTGYLSAGPQTLNGEQALIFARSRHAYDDLGDGDRYRAAHQRVLIAAIAKKLLSSNPAAMVSAIDTLANYISTDMSPDYIVSLALAMRGIDVDHDVYSTMNPTEPDTGSDGSIVEITQEEEWERMMAEVDAGERPDADAGYISKADDINNPAFSVEETSPADTRVVVKDASGGSGRAAAAIAELQEDGWYVEDGGEANVELEATTVVYEYDAQRANAQAVAELLGATCEPAGDTWGVQGDVMVVVGAS